MKFYTKKLTNKRNFKNIPELKMQRDALSIINLRIETINKLDPVLIVDVVLLS